MVTTASAEPGVRSQAFPPGLPHGWKDSKPSFTIFPGNVQGVGVEVVQ